MQLGIEGKTAVVGGSSEGLGFETARALAEEGVRVVVCSRDEAKLSAAVSAIGGDASGFVADLSEPKGAAALIDEAQARLGAIDILVANVGGPPPGPAEAADLDGLQKALDRCLLSMVTLCQGVLPGMRERRWGRILAITSAGVRTPLAGMVYSNVARSGLTAYLKTLSREVIKDGVTVNSILPGSQVTKRLSALMGDRVDEYFSALPAGRGGRPEDFGHIAAFLCSEPANYLTGVALPVDGGVDSGLL